MSSSLFLYNQISFFLLLGFGIYLSILIYSVNQAARLNRVFILFVFLTLVYASVPYLANVIGPSELSLIYIKLGFAAGALSGYLGYILTINLFPGLERKRWIDVATLFIGLFGFLFAISPYLITTIESTVWGVNPVLGEKERFIFYASPVFFVFLVIYYSLKGYLKATAGEKGKYKYFLTGFIIFIIWVAIFIIFLPLKGPVARYWSVGVSGFIFFISGTAITIFRKGGFEVKAILTDFLVGIFAIALLILPIFSTGIARIFSLFLFALFFIIGYSLIKYSHSEAKRKEVLEIIVKERTRELEKNYQELKINEIELNKWYHLTIGRELRMVELKDEIKKLKGKPKKMKTAIINNNA